MSSIFPTNVRILTATILAVLVYLMLTGLARAQFAPPAAAGPHATSNPPADGRPTTVSGPALTESCVVEVPPADYWIVSSWRCPQSGIPWCEADRLDYFHVGEDRRFQHRDLGTLQRSIHPGIPVCIVVHGSFTTWDSLRSESVKIFDWIRRAAPERPLHVVFFTWPSNGPITYLPHIDIAILGRRASFNGFYLSQLLGVLPKKSPIGFFGHSHGARAVASALHLSAGGEVQGYQLRTPRSTNGQQVRIVLSAAAIDHHWLNPGERFGRALDRVDTALVLHNRDDLPLNVYSLRRLFSHRPLGLIGFDGKDVCLQNGRIAKVAQLDVTSLIRNSHFWNHYFSRDEIAASMVRFVYFDDVVGAHSNRSPSDRQQISTGP